MSAQNLEAMLGSRKTLLIGTPRTPLERAIATRLAATSTYLVRAEDASELRECLRLPAAADALAVVIDAALINASTVSALASARCRGIVWAAADSIADELLHAARPHRLRFLGPRTAGFWKLDGLSAGAFPCGLGGGQLALIAQSGSIAAAAVDWAAGRGIGFSWAVTTGAEQDADLADFLDLAALDPATSAVILQLGRIRGGRKFMSAARACARVKPVVVLQSRLAGSECGRTADPVRSAAFARAGLVECETLDMLFDALSALALVPARASARVLVAGNGAGVCALGIDAALRSGLALAQCSAEHFGSVRGRAPRARRLNGAVDLGAIEPDGLAQICETLLDDPEVDYLLLVHSPSLDSAHQPYVQALRKLRPDPRLVTVWLGLESATSARRSAIEAGLASFATADQAARAIHYRWLHRRTRELLMQTPPPRQTPGTDCRSAAALVEAALRRGESRLGEQQAAQLLACYGLPSTPLRAQHPACWFELTLARHAELGMHLSLSAGCGPLRSAVAYGFAPLDGLLARRMLEVLKLPDDTSFTAAMQDTLCASLLVLSDIALELPDVASLRIRLGVDALGTRQLASAAEIGIEAAAPERQRLMLAPYPTSLVKTVTTHGGRVYRLRPIRPEDEPMVVALLERMRPEDVRLRFFASIRYFSHAMSARMTQIDYDRELVIAAEDPEQPGALCALAQLVLGPYGVSGEFAIMVHHAHAGAGLGHVLMDELLDYGRRRGLHRICGDVLRENTPMLALAQELGFSKQPHADEPDCWRVEISLSPPPDSVGTFALAAPSGTTDEH